MRRLSRRELMEALGGTVGSALMGAALPPMDNTTAGDLHVEEQASEITIDNGLVRAQFRKVPDGIDQEYSARGPDGQWIPLVGSLRPPRPRPIGCAPLYSDRQVASEHRLLAAEAFREFRVAQKSDTEVRVELRGAIGAHTIEQTVTLSTGLKHVHVEVRAELAGSPHGSSTCSQRSRLPAAPGPTSPMFPA